MKQPTKNEYKAVLKEVVLLTFRSKDKLPNERLNSIKTLLIEFRKYETNKMK